MAGGADDNRSIDSVGVHAGLVVVVHSDQGPVHDDTGNPGLLGVAGWRGPGDQVLDAGCVEHLDVGERQDPGEEGRCEKRGVLHDDVVRVLQVLFVRNAEFVQEGLRGTTHDHGGEELAAEPGTAACRLLVW